MNAYVHPLHDHEAGASSVSVAASLGQHDSAAAGLCLL